MSRAGHIPSDATARFMASMGLKTMRFAANLRTVFTIGAIYCQLIPPGAWRGCDALFVRRSKRMTDRSVATDPTTDVSTWLKHTSVMVSAKLGHCIFCGAVLCSRSQTLIHPTPEDAAKLFPFRWNDSDVYGPPSCHVARGSESLGEL